MNVELSLLELRALGLSGPDSFLLPVFQNPDFSTSACACPIAVLTYRQEQSRPVDSLGHPHASSVGKSDCLTCWPFLAAVNGLLLAGQRHLIAQRPERAPCGHPRTVQPLSQSQQGLVFTEAAPSASSACGPELPAVATLWLSKEDPILENSEVT